MAGRIIRNVLVPQFRAGNFDQGVLDGVQAMIGVVRGEYQAPEKIPSRRSSKVNGTYLGLVGFIVCIFLISTLGKLFRFFGVGHSQRSHRSAGWFGGSGGGGFSSGGFSGGGGFYPSFGVDFHDLDRGMVNDISTGDNRGILKLYPFRNRVISFACLRINLRIISIGAPDLDA